MPHAYILIDKPFNDAQPNVHLMIGPENAHAVAFAIEQIYIPAMRAMGSYERSLEIYRGKNVMFLSRTSDNEPIHVSVKDANWERIEFYELVEDLKAATPVKEAQFNEPTETNANA